MAKVSSDDTQHKKSERGIGQFIVYLIIVVFVIGAGLRWRSQQELRAVHVSGLQYMSEAEVLAVLDSTIVPRKMADIKLHIVRTAVLTLPYVHNVVVERNNENEINIQVTERKPLALIVRSGGDLQYVDDESVLLPYRFLANGSDVPIVRGIDRNGSIDTVVLQSVITMLRELRSEENALVFNDISELRYDSDKKTYSFESSADASNVLFGSFDNHAEKIRNLCSLVRYVGQQQNQGAASLIDVRWAKKVFVTRRAAKQ